MTNRERIALNYAMFKRNHRERTRGELTPAEQHWLDAYRAEKSYDDEVRDCRLAQQALCADLVPRTGVTSISLAPDDPRHGTLRGYNAFRCRCDRCREAKRLYTHLLKHDTDGPRCSVKACGRAATSRGWCEAHYARWRNTGTAGTAPARRYTRRDIKVHSPRPWVITRSSRTES